jgi:hypothetical protein
LFFFLTLFMQAVWGYSALRTGVAYLPMMGAIMALSGASAQLVPGLAAGFSRGFEVAAGILLLALIVTVAAIRVRRADLDGREGQSARG